MKMRKFDFEIEKLVEQLELMSCLRNRHSYAEEYCEAFDATLDVLRHLVIYGEAKVKQND